VLIVIHTKKIADTDTSMRPKRLSRSHAVKGKAVLNPFVGELLIRPCRIAQSCLSITFAGNLARHLHAQRPSLKLNCLPNHIEWGKGADICVPAVLDNLDLHANGFPFFSGGVVFLKRTDPANDRSKQTRTRSSGSPATDQSERITPALRFRNRFDAGSAVRPPGFLYSAVLHPQVGMFFVRGFFKLSGRAAVTACGRPDSGFTGFFKLPGRR
jgi:hypothetical protein